MKNDSIIATSAHEKRKSNICTDEQELIDDVVRDFENRKFERKNLEKSFLLSINFVLGNQNVFISSSGEVESIEKQYIYESQEVFNHIGPIIETRMSKLGRVRPLMVVRPAGSEEHDIYSAKMATSILSSISSKHKLDEIIALGTLWSEVCGTSFYKIVWNTDLGDFVGEKDGKKIPEGDVQISVCPPFEIFPDDPNANDVDECSSVIHAKAYPVDYVKEMYGVDVEGEEIDVFAFGSTNTSSAFATTGQVAGSLLKEKKKGHVLVIERYEAPTKSKEFGRLTIVAGGKLLFDGDMPFVLGENGKVGFPFVRQISLQNVGSFWGGSVVERCIPVQRAYNLIKNKKHELMTRLASGILAVEDGSVDIDNLEEEGLVPGKILVYRNGASAPRFMDPGHVPNEFANEETRLLAEFISLSGVSEFMRSSAATQGITSGVALALLVEQDDTRLSTTAELIRFAVREIGVKILRLFKQFASTKRLAKVVGANGEIEVLQFESSDLDSDDVVLETTNELSENPATRKSMVLDLFKSGLFHDEKGKLNNRMRSRILDALGFGTWENVKDLEMLHIKRAVKENMGIEPLKCLEVDDHEMHISEHTKHILSESSNYDEKRLKELIRHVDEHKALKLQQQAHEALGGQLALTSTGG